MTVSHQRDLVVKLTIDLQKKRKIIPAKRYYLEYNKTNWSNVYKEYHSLKRKPKKLKLIELYEEFQPHCEQERVDKEKKKNFQYADEVLKTRKSNTISLALTRKEDEDSLHDTYSVEKESEQKENKLEEGETNSETEMNEYQKEIK